MILGEEPFISCIKGGRTREETYVYCLPCVDGLYYSPKDRLSSTFSHCDVEKDNRCTDEDNKQDCGEIPWNKETYQDGNCSCKAGYRIVAIQSSEKCFRINHACVKICKEYQDYLSKERFVIPI